MDTNQINRIKLLALSVVKASVNYYNDVPIMSDGDFDKLVEELTSLDPEHPVLGMIGAKPQRNAVQLENRMYSLEKAKEIQGLFTWLKRLEGHMNDYVASFKVDGSAVDFIYTKGNDGYYYRTKAFTRGNGEEGEDISHQLWNCPIKGAPIVVHVVFVGATEIRLPDRFHIYGEIYISKKDFRILNLQRKAVGEELFSNPRNTANGALSLQDRAEIAKRRLSFAMYNTDLDLDMMDKLFVANAMGIETVPYHYVSADNPIILRKKFRDFYEKTMDDAFNDGLDMEIDGLVVAHNLKRVQDDMGYTSHHPRWAVAVKFPDEQKKVKIKYLDWTVSKNGTVTPQAVFDPVQLSGAEIERVTLHNAWHVKEYNLSPGDVILICRSGGVIPKFLEVILSGDKDHEFPSSCPTCGFQLEYEEPLLVCPNSDCSSKLAGLIEHFTAAIDFKGAGEVVCNKLVEAKVVTDLPSLFELSPLMLITTLGWSREHAVSFMLDLKGSIVNVPMDKFLYSLGVPGLGKTLSKKIATKFKTVGEILQSPVREFDEYGPTIGPNVHKGLVKRLIQNYPRLRKLGLTIQEYKTTSGLRIVVTGTLSLPRKQIQEMIEHSGNTFQSSITKDTDYLVVGEDVGANKLAKAKKYGTKTISWDEYLALISDQDKESNE